MTDQTRKPKASKAREYCRLLRSSIIDLSDDDRSMFLRVAAAAGEFDASSLPGLLAPFRRQDTDKFMRLWEVGAEALRRKDGVCPTCLDIAMVSLACDGCPRALLEVSPLKQPPAAATTSRPTSAEEARAAYNPARDTDVGNAERLLKTAGHLIRFTRELGWLVWDGRRWHQDETAIREIYKTRVIPEIYHEAAAAAQSHNPILTKMLANWARRSESDNRVNASLNMASSTPGTYVKQSDFDRDKWAFNVLNGTIDLRTGQMRPHRQEDQITRLAPVEYDPAATCPQWLAFVERVMGGDRAVIDYLQRAIGYSLTGSTEEQCMFISWGTGKNGKSVMLDTVAKLLGDYGTETPAETLMIRRSETSNSNDLARLIGARFVSANETEEGQRLAESKVKGMTGGDIITARFLHREFFQFRPEFKLWLRTNHKPSIRGTDEGIWRRMHLIPFAVTIPEAERDPKLAEKLALELPGILAWAVAGCLAWQRMGLQPPQAVRAATDEYRMGQDVLAGFLADRTVENPYGWTSVKALYASYTDWCDETGERPVTKRVFCDRLVERNFKPRRGTGNVKLFDGLTLVIEKQDSSVSENENCDRGDVPESYKVTESYRFSGKSPLRDFFSPTSTKTDNSDNLITPQNENLKEGGVTIL